MKLTARIKLLPTTEQFVYLKQTLEVGNAACNYISNQAWGTKTFHRFPLQKLVYKDIRSKFLLSAQMTLHCISKVSDTYKPNNKMKHIFRPHGAVAFDDRNLSYKLENSTVSIWSLGGRQIVPFVCGKRDRKMLNGRRGESVLCYIKDMFYLLAVCDVEIPTVQDRNDFLGIDLGIVNLASDSDGECFSGEQVEKSRRKYLHRRRNLQRKGTRSAKRKLKSLSGRQANFQRNINHNISKRVVQKAQDTQRGIALEDLSGIREAPVRRKQRARHANWSFYQLRTFINYKAQWAGIPVIFVDPHNTSRTCPSCGCVDKHNRLSQSNFQCIQCGYAAPADTVAAVNISARAAIARPMVSFNLIEQKQVADFQHV